jgi:ketosteroid isomerase-like protein
MTIDYASGGDLLEAYARAWASFDGDAWVALFSEDAEYHGDPFGVPLVGRNALRAFLLESGATQRDVEFTIERHWVSGSTVLAAWHATWIGRVDGTVARTAGFLTADLAADGRIDRFHETWMRAPTTTE